MDREPKGQARRFYWIISVVLLVYAGIAWHHHHEGRARVMALIAAGLLGGHYLFPAFSSVLFRVQQRLVSKIGWALTSLFLILFFYVIFTPYGLLIQLFRKDALRRQYEPDKPSYWIERAYSEAHDKACENPY